MPLDADGEAARQLDALDDLVRRDRVDPRPPRIANGLVVRRVHLKVADAEDRLERRALEDLHRMAGLARVELLLVIEGALHLVADILVERAAQLDREELHAAADAKERQLDGERGAQEPLLVGGAGALHRAQAAAGPLAGELARAIGRPAG